VQTGCDTLILVAPEYAAAPLRPCPVRFDLSGPLSPVAPAVRGHLGRSATSGGVVVDDLAGLLVLAPNSILRNRSIVVPFAESSCVRKAKVSTAVLSVAQSVSLSAPVLAVRQSRATPRAAGRAAWATRRVGVASVCSLWLHNYPLNDARKFLHHGRLRH